MKAARAVPEPNVRLRTTQFYRPRIGTVVSPSQVAPLALSRCVVRHDVLLMRRPPPKSTVEDLARPILPGPNEHKSPAPGVVVACWCGLVERMDRRDLDRFTRRIWKRFDHRDLEPLKSAIIRRRRVLTMQFRPWLGLEPALNQRVIEPVEEHAATIAAAVSEASVQLRDRAIDASVCGRRTRSPEGVRPSRGSAARWCHVLRLRTSSSPVGKSRQSGG